LLKSTTGLPTGPYVDVKTDGPMTPQIDASLFQDDDGKVYYLFQDGKIALMNSTMTALAETPHLLSPKNNANVGFEGAYIAKINGRYFLMGAAFNTDTGISTYDCMAASSDKLLGPYGDRYLAFRHGGHNMVFKDKKNVWWSTMFGNDNGAPIRERPGLFRVEVDAFGQLQPYYQPTLSQGKTVTTDANNPAFAPSNGNDGHTASRWAGANGNAGHWWTVDLGKDYRLTNSIVMWEKLGIVYKYRIETSRNNSQWKTVVDRTNNTLITQTQGSDFIDTARYVRITITGLATNVLPSFYEFQVLGESLATTVRAIQKDARHTGSMVFGQGKMQQMGEPIRFNLSEAGSVTLEAYSLDGNKIATIAKGYYGSGTHSLSLHGQGADDRLPASGEVILKLKSVRGVIRF
jgi:F5/8 type C domain/Glycosyl hydrolases family 43